MRIIFFTPSPELAAKFDEQDQKDRATSKAARKLARKYGGTRTFWRDGRCVGFRFVQPPDPKHWTRLIGTADGFRPRSRKSAVCEELSQLTVTTGEDIVDLLKVPGSKRLQFDEDQRCVILSAGLEKLDGRYVIAVPAQFRNLVKGCTRISDLEYEAMEVADKQTKKRNRKRRKQ